MNDIPTEPATVILDQDEQMVATQTLSELFMVYRSLVDGVRKNSFEVEFAATLIMALETYTERLGSTLGVETERLRQSEELSSRIRGITKNLHTEIDHLNRQLRKGVTVANAKSILRDYVESIGQWWKNTGLGSCYLSDSHFTMRGSLILKLPISLDELTSIMSDTPVSDKDAHVLRIKGVQERFDIISDGSREYEMLDTPENREKLSSLIYDRFPNALITRFENRMASKNNRDMVVTHVGIIIHTYD